MTYCVQLRAAFSSQARRDAVLADVQARIAARPRWAVDMIEPATLRIGANGLLVMLWFTARADADDLAARIEGFAAGLRAPLAGSWLEVHNCTHDEGQNECVVVARRDW